MSDLSESEKAYFRKMFDLYDTDKSENIGLSELKNLSKHLGVELSEDELLNSVRSIGVPVTNREVDLDFNQFIKWLKSAQAAGDEFALLKAKITAHGAKALNNEQIARLKEVFEHFDADNSGSIDAEELGNVFASMGQELSPDELRKMLDDVDDDKSGEIEFNEFMMLMCSNFGGDPFEEDMRLAFQSVDGDGTGRISVAELRQMMNDTTGGLLTADEMDRIIDSVEKNEDGTIDYMKWESLWEAAREEQQ